QLRETLASDFPDISRHQENLAFVLNILDLLLRDTGRPRDAEEAQKRALAINKKLAANHPDVPRYRYLVGGSLHNLAMNLANRGDMDEAIRLLKEAVDHQQAALKLSPRNPDYRTYLRNHYVLLSDVLIRLGDHRAAAKWAAELGHGDFPEWDPGSVAFKAAD